MDFLVVNNLQAATKWSPSKLSSACDTEKLDIENADIKESFEGPGSGLSFESGTNENPASVHLVLATLDFHSIILAPKEHLSLLLADFLYDSPQGSY